MPPKSDVGRRCAVLKYEYASNGRLTAQRYFDANVRPVRALRSGRTIIRIKYDERNLKVEQSSFDEHDDPVDTKDGRWSVRQWTFDTNGQLTKNILRDTAGNVREFKEKGPL